MLKSLLLSLFTASLLLIGFSACRKPISDKKARQLIVGTWKYGDIAEITFEGDGKVSAKLNEAGIKGITDALRSQLSAGANLQQLVQQVQTLEQSQSQDIQSQLQSLLGSNGVGGQLGLLSKSLEATYTVTKDKVTITGKTKKPDNLGLFANLDLLNGAVEIFPEQGKTIDLSIQKLTKTELAVTSSSGKRYDLRRK